MQETDTFNPVPTTLADFEMVALLEGEAMLSRVDSSGPIAGYLAAVRESGRDVRTMPVLRADAQSGGRLSRATLDGLCDRIRVRLQESLPVDGLVVLLHGAASADGVDDVEGHVLAMIREVVGRSVPLALMLDHHANVTTEMIEHSDVVMAFRTQPHDPFDTARDLDPSRTASHLGRGASDRGVAKAPDDHAPGAVPDVAWPDEGVVRPGTEHGARRACAVRLAVPDAAVARRRRSRVVGRGGTDDDRPAAEALADELSDLAWAMRLRFHGTGELRHRRGDRDRRRSRARHGPAERHGRFGPRR